ncbi:hypothetical protein PR202_ga00621 [Eleusine coracana subsp. coracana]|uniref:F-box protein AT5G49610-like beta-propeller domain-containing protein n=1 Tax=Eleusine coracana subsp. coracana TaxID=191504 RepID=A0AAV5BH02_ELECO|nr:hypothetical protein PR202_ga00621 [Eleusine coracana subsp. coracana]
MRGQQTAEDTRPRQKAAARIHEGEKKGSHSPQPNWRLGVIALDDATRKRTNPSSPPAAIASVLTSDDLLGEILLRLASPSPPTSSTPPPSAGAGSAWPPIAPSSPASARATRRPSSASTPSPDPAPAPPPSSGGRPAGTRRRSPPPSAAQRHSSTSPAAASSRTSSTPAAAASSSTSAAASSSTSTSSSQAMVVLTPPGREDADGLDHVSQHTRKRILPEHGCDGRQCLELLQIHRRQKRQTVLQVNAFQDGAWTTLASVATDLLETHFVHKILPIGSRLFMTTWKNIVVLDTVSSTVSFIDYPDEEINHVYGGWLSSKADEGHNDDPGVYLVNVVDWQQLHIWLNGKAAGRGGMSGWLLVDSFCLTGIFDDLGMRYALYRVACVGDNAAFVVLEMDGSLFYFHAPGRTVEMVFKAAPGGKCSKAKVWPFMMP